jgi:hypothetical protein
MRDLLGITHGTAWLNISFSEKNQSDCRFSPSLQDLVESRGGAVV